MSKKLDDAFGRLANGLERYRSMVAANQAKLAGKEYGEWAMKDLNGSIEQFLDALKGYSAEWKEIEGDIEQKRRELGVASRDLKNAQEKLEGLVKEIAKLEVVRERAMS